MRLQALRHCQLLLAGCCTVFIHTREECCTGVRELPTHQRDHKQ
jgi:hypothetical protein